MAKKKNYVDSKALEEYWTGWEMTGCQFAWDAMTSMIYEMCEGIATHFNPPSPDVHSDHTHDAFALTIEKIKNGKLKFTPGKAPVFNLLTTTIFRHLYSKMNKDKRRKFHHNKYIEKYILENHDDIFLAVQNGFLQNPIITHQ